MQYEIKGGNLPVVICSLDNGESVFNESGAMCWMSPNMEMTTSGGGIGKMFGRMFSGENLFHNIYTAAVRLSLKLTAQRLNMTWLPDRR